MSTATQVPETWELTGDDARRTLQQIGLGELVTDSWQRLRFADGFSHARSLAYAISLVLVQAIISLVGVASAFGSGGERGMLIRSLKAAVPGPAGQMLTDAVQQARHAGASHQYLGLTFGLVGALVTGATLMGQVERALNRIYGVEEDRPTFEKYRRALGLAVTAGALAAAASVVLVFGNRAGQSIGDGVVSTIWDFGRWPVALVLMASAIALLFRWAPRRHQPGWSWLTFGAAVSVVLWAAATLVLGGFFAVSTSFGKTYGPLAGIVALLLWSLLSSIALLYGAAIAAQLESVRAGEPEPQDEQKVEHSEPGLEPVAVGQ